jgi:hypothetical protein
MSFGFVCGSVDAQTQMTSSDFDSILSRDNSGYRIEGNLFVKDSLQPSTFIYLDSVANFLVAHPNVSLEIICSPDQKCIDKHYSLGQKRELMVYDYLIRKNVSKEQVVIFGYSESSNSNLDKHYFLVDRIEFVVLKI